MMRLSYDLPRRLARDTRGAITAIFAFVVLGGFLALVLVLNNMAAYASMDRSIRAAARSTAYQLAQSRLDWTDEKSVADVTNEIFATLVQPDPRAPVTVAATREGTTVSVTVVGSYDIWLRVKYPINVTASAPVKDIAISFAVSIATASFGTTAPTTTYQTGAHPNALLTETVVNELRSRLTIEAKSALLDMMDFMSAYAQTPAREPAVRIGIVPFNHQIRVATSGATPCIQNRTKTNEANLENLTAEGFGKLDCTIGTATLQQPHELPPTTLSPPPGETDRLKAYISSSLKGSRSVRGGCRNTTLGLMRGYHNLRDFDPLTTESVLVLVTDGRPTGRYTGSKAFEASNGCGRGPETNIRKSLEDACEYIKQENDNTKFDKKSNTGKTGARNPVRLIIINTGSLDQNTLVGGCATANGTRYVQAVLPLNAGNNLRTAALVADEILGSTALQLPASP